MGENYFSEWNIHALKNSYQEHIDLNISLKMYITAQLISEDMSLNCTVIMVSNGDTIQATDMTDESVEEEISENMRQSS